MKKYLISLGIILCVVVVIVYSQVMKEVTEHQFVATSNITEGDLSNWSERMFVSDNNLEDDKQKVVNWLNGLKNEHPTDTYVLYEYIDRSQIKNTAFINELYDTSENYKESIEHYSNNIEQYEDIMHSENKIKPNAETIMRRIIFVKDASILQTEIDYVLETGKLSVILVSPDKTIRTISKLSSSYKGIDKIELTPGLWSLIYIYKADNNGLFTGTQTINMQLN